MEITSIPNSIPTSTTVSEYEKKHLAAQKKRTAEVRRLYEKAINEAAQVAVLENVIEGQLFDITKRTVLMGTINDLVNKLQKDVSVIIRNGIQDSWDLSNAKNDAIFDHRIDRTLIPSDVQAKFYNPNKPALDEFLKRVDKGMGLSNGIKANGKKGIWNFEKQFKIELEQSLAEGIASGKSANKMATEAKRFLEDPDTLFRRVRDSKGKLKLSKAARDYRPGQGKYRSSFLNAKRLTATETNMAYRKADNERYKRAPDVIGYRVNLSNNHPSRDICDDLALVYPCDFVWQLWHVQCRCFVTPELAPDEEFDKYLEAVRAGEGDKFVFKGTVKDMPKEFNNWVTDNKDRINRGKSLPYWVSDNVKQTADLLK